MVGGGNVIQMIREWVGGRSHCTYDGYYINCNILLLVRDTHTTTKNRYEMDL